MTAADEYFIGEKRWLSPRQMGRRSWLWKRIMVTLVDAPVGFRLGHSHPDYQVVFTVLESGDVSIVSLTTKH